MSWKSPIPTRSLLLLSFLLVLSGPALEGCQSASVGDTSGAKPPEAAEEHESNRIYKNAGKVCCIQTLPDSNRYHLNSNHWYINTVIFSFLTRGMGISMNMKMCTMLEMVITGKAMFFSNPYNYSTFRETYGIYEAKSEPLHSTILLYSV